MIGVVLVTHGRLAEELKAATEHVVGPQADFLTVCIGPQDNMETRRDEILAAIRTVDSGSGVILLMIAGALYARAVLRSRTG